MKRIHPARRAKAEEQMAECIGLRSSMDDTSLFFTAEESEALVAWDAVSHLAATANHDVASSIDIYVEETPLRAATWGGLTIVLTNNGTYIGRGGARNCCGVFVTGTLKHDDATRAEMLRFLRAVCVELSLITFTR